MSAPLPLPAPVVTGADDAEPLVLVHPLGMNAGFWDLVAHELVDYRTIAYDLPGHGEAPVSPAPYYLEDLSDQLACLLDDLDVPSAHVLGMSMGGLVAQRFAVDHGDRVRSLVLADTVTRYPDFAQADWLVRAETARTAGVRALVDHLLPVWFTPRAEEDSPAAVAFVRESLTAMDGEGYAMACEVLSGADLTDVVERITAPTLVVYGDKDLPGIAVEAEAIRSRVRNCGVETIAEGGHAALAERPTQFGTIVRAFLAAYASGSGA